MSILGLLDDRQRLLLGFCLLLGAIATGGEVLALSLIASFFDLLSGAEKEASRLLQYIVLYIRPSSDPITRAGILALVAVALSSVMRVVGTFFRIRFVWYMQQQLSSRVFRYLQSANYSRVTVTGRQELVKIFANDTVSYCNGVLENVIKLITDAMTVLGILIMLLFYNWQVTVSLVIAMAALMSALLLMTSWRTFSLGERKTRFDGFRISMFDEYLGGIKSIRAMGLDFFFGPRINGVTTQFALAFRNQQVLKQLPRFLIEFVVYTCGLAALLYSYAEGVPPELIWGSAGVYAFSTLRLVPATMSAYQSLNTIRFNIPAGEAVRSTLDFLKGEVASIAAESEGNFVLKVSSDDPEKSPRVASDSRLLEVRVEQDNALARYFSFPRGVISGIVGGSGSGKTTLLDSIAGIRSTDGWHVTYVVSGELAEDQRISIGYVEQEPPIFGASIILNIVLKDDPSHAEVEGAKSLLESLGLGKFLIDDSIENILDSRLLSGGEKLRIGLARALFRKVDLLLLDEPTSGLDKESEAMVLDLLEGISREVVVICVAHRQQNIDRCSVLADLNVES